MEKVTKKDLKKQQEESEEEEEIEVEEIEEEEEIEEKELGEDFSKDPRALTFVSDAGIIAESNFYFLITFIFIKKIFD
jgi:hypothetical protein